MSDQFQLVRHSRPTSSRHAGVTGDGECRCSAHSAETGELLGCSTAEKKRKQFTLQSNHHRGTVTPREMATSHQQLAREILAPRSFEHNGQQLAFAFVLSFTMPSSSLTVLPMILDLLGVYLYLTPDRSPFFISRAHTNTPTQPHLSGDRRRCCRGHSRTLGFRRPAVLHLVRDLFLLWLCRAGRVSGASAVQRRSAAAAAPSLKSAIRRNPFRKHIIHFLLLKNRGN